MSNGLYDCDRCGGEVFIKEISRYDSGKDCEFYAECSECGLRTRIFPDINAAIAAWNRDWRDDDE